MAGTSTELTVRPTPALLLRRIFESSDGKLIFFVIAVAIAGAAGAVGRTVGTAAAIGLAVVLGGLVVLALARVRLHVSPGAVVVANPLRTYRLSAADIADLAVQSVQYTRSGSTLNQTYRLMIITAAKDKRGQPLVRPVFATERKDPEKVETMYRQFVSTIQPTVPPIDPPSSSLAGASEG